MMYGLMEGDGMKGRVLWWTPKLGYGKIIGEDRIEYFAHYKQVVGEGRRDLYEGEIVEFATTQTPKGPAAAAIRRP